MPRNKVKAIDSDVPWNEDLRSWLVRHLEEHQHLNLAILSRSQYIGVSRQALESYLNGTYFLPKSSGGEGVDPRASTLERSIKAYRDRVDLPVRHAYAGKFVKTNNWFKLQSACQTAINNRVIVVVYGGPGIGKTRCLTEFALKKLITYPVMVLCSRNVIPSYFVLEISRIIGAPRHHTIAFNEGEIVRILGSYPRPIFVDQANYLNEKSLGTLCYIWEKTKVPIVLVGTKDLYTEFTQSTATEDVRAQISSRVAMYYQLSELSIAEAKAILQRGLEEYATDQVVAEIYNTTAGVYRHIEMIIPRIRELIALNKEDLESGEATMNDIIKIAGSRLAT